MRSIALGLVWVGLIGPAHAAPPADNDRPSSSASPKVPPGTVLTFYGLRRLEQDPTISDDVKVKEWAAFVARATEQIAYAKKAEKRWKEAAKLRLVESARLAEKNEAYSHRQRVAQWKAVLDAYPKSDVAAQARERATHWRAQELERLVLDAEGVESSGAPKVDRIRAWLSVVGWNDTSREGRAARRRIDALQKQLYSEAESVDSIERIDAATKLEAWQDVLNGDPSKSQRAKAERRLAQLKAQLGD